MRMKENNLGWYVKNSVEPLIESVEAAEIIEYNDTVNKKETDEKETRYWLSHVVCCARTSNSKKLCENTRSIKQPNKHFVECVTRKMKQYLILRANAKIWHKRSTREGMIMLQE